MIEDFGGITLAEVNGIFFSTDNPPELPSRPPLPVEMRPKLVADIASSHSPNTQRDMLEAEHNLEQRMKQPAFFNYPTPTHETLPAFPQVGYYLLAIYYRKKVILKLY